ncbi:unnamed protein product [Victoria cruziana]
MRQMIRARFRGATGLLPSINSPATLSRLWTAAAGRDRHTYLHEVDKKSNVDVANIISEECHNCWVPHPESGTFVPPSALEVKGSSVKVTVRHDPSVSKVWVRSTETMENKDYFY